MLDSITPTKPAEPTRGPILRFLSQPGVLAGSAALNIVVMAVAGSIWIGAHNRYWKGQFECFAYFDISVVERWGLIAATLATGVAATVLLFRIARSRRAPLHRLTYRYWLATAALWTAAVAGINSARVAVEFCQRGGIL